MFNIALIPIPPPFYIRITGGCNGKLMCTHLYLMFRFITVQRWCSPSGSSASLWDKFHFNSVFYSFPPPHHSLSFIPELAKRLVVHAPPIVSPLPFLMLPVVFPSQPQVRGLFICKKEEKLKLKFSSGNSIHRNYPVRMPRDASSDDDRLLSLVPPIYCFCPCTGTERPSNSLSP